MRILGWFVDAWLHLLDAILPKIPGGRPIETDPAWDVLPEDILRFPCPWCGAKACDCVARINCPDAGQIQHLACGWCAVHAGPRFACLCAVAAARKVS